MLLYTEIVHFDVSIEKLLNISRFHLYFSFRTDHGLIVLVTDISDPYLNRGPIICQITYNTTDIMSLVGKTSVYRRTVKVSTIIMIIYIYIYLFCF